MMKNSNDFRAGVWTLEEQDYAAALIAAFHEGRLGNEVGKKRG